MTASLFANSCKAVAIIGNCPVTQREISYEFGKNLGIAHHIIKDIDHYNKTLSTNNLNISSITPSLLYASGSRPEMKEYLPLRSEEDFKTANELLQDTKDETSPIVKQRELALTFLGRAVSAVLDLPPTNARSELLALVQNFSMRIQENNHSRTLSFV